VVSVSETIEVPRDEFEQLVDRVDQIEEENEQLRDRVDRAEERAERAERIAEELEEKLNDYDIEDHEYRLDALSRRTEANMDRICEIQARELEKGAHLWAENVDPREIEVAEGKLERITKDDGREYFRLPGEEDALERGGAVAHSTADLLPLQRLSRYDDDMLASVTNRKPDELAAKAWRERDDAGRYGLWSKGSGEWRVYLKSSDLTEWIRANEDGVSKNWAQELARRTMDAMISLSKSRLGKKRKNRTADGLSYQENVVVLKADVDLPGEIASDAPDTDEVAG
jgi:vacuolar-type H+-ATPase subunit I/STV1